MVEEVSNELYGMMTPRGMALCSGKSKCIIVGLNGKLDDNRKMRTFKTVGGDIKETKSLRLLGIDFHSKCDQ